MKTRLRYPVERTELMGLRRWNGRVLTNRPRLGQPGQEILAPGIGRLDTQRHLPKAKFGELLAVAQLVDIDRWKESDHRLGLAQAHHLPKMRHQVEIAEPGEQRAPIAAERNTIEPRVGDRNRLHPDRLFVAP